VQRDPRAEECACGDTCFLGRICARRAESPAYAEYGILGVVAESPLKPVVWVGDSLRALKAFPAAVQEEVGYALFLAQCGEKHESAKPLKGLGAGVLEIVSDHRGDTFRAVYTVRIGAQVFVLHAFQKKSKRGVATPQAEIEMIKRRLKRAVEISEAGA
jgi:phage-related protein